MTNFGKFQEVDGLGDPLDLGALNTILVDNHFGEVYGENTSGATRKYGHKSRNLIGTPIRGRLEPQIKREVYDHLLKLFKRNIESGAWLIYHELIGDQMITVLDEEAIVKRKSVLEKQFVIIRKKYRIADDFNFKRNGGRPEIDFFEQLRQVRENLIEKLDGHLELVCHYLKGNDNAIKELYPKSCDWLSKVVDFECRLKFLVPLNNQIKVYENKYFTLEPHCDHILNEMMVDGLRKMEAVDFLLQELARKDLDQARIEILFHTMVKCGFLKRQKNKLFMVFLHRHLGWNPATKELRKPKDGIYKHQEIKDHYTIKLTNLSLKK